MNESDDTSTSCDSTLTNESQKQDLFQIYQSGVKREFRKSTLQSINKAIHKIALPKIKFLPGSMGKSTMRTKAEIWMTYRNKVREQFGLHRSAVTMKIKKKFIKGKPKIACNKEMQ